MGKGIFVEFFQMVLPAPDNAAARRTIASRHTSASDLSKLSKKPVFRENFYF
jgi:hypothetical protein